MLGLAARKGSQSLRDCQGISHVHIANPFWRFRRASYNSYIVFTELISGDSVGGIYLNRKTVNPPIWIDRMELAVRGDAPVAMLRFLTIISPQNMLEVCRVQTTVQHLQQIADVLCRSLNHYPEKPVAEKRSSKNGKP